MELAVCRGQAKVCTNIPTISSEAPAPIPEPGLITSILRKSLIIVNKYSVHWLLYWQLRARDLCRYLFMSRMGFAYIRNAVKIEDTVEYGRNTKPSNAEATFFQSTRTQNILKKTIYDLSNGKATFVQSTRIL